MQKTSFFMLWAVALSLITSNSVAVADLVYVDDSQVESQNATSTVDPETGSFNDSIRTEDTSISMLPADRFDTTASAIQLKPQLGSERAFGWSGIGTDYEFRAIPKPVDMTELHVVPGGDLSVRSLDALSSDYDLEAELQRAITQASARKIHDSVRVKVKSVKRRKNDSASVWRFPAPPISDLFDPQFGR